MTGVKLQPHYSAPPKPHYTAPPKPHYTAPPKTHLFGASRHKAAAKFAEEDCCEDADLADEVDGACEDYGDKGYFGYHDDADLMDELNDLEAEAAEEGMCAASMDFGLMAAAAPAKAAMLEACGDMMADATEEDELAMMMMMDCAPSKSMSKGAMMSESSMAPAKSNDASDDKYFLEAVKCTVKQVKKKHAASKMMI